MSSSILPVPTTLKPCQTYLKLAADHEKINPTLTYWCRLYALQTGLKIDSKAKENREFLMSIMDWLEQEKKIKENDEKYTNETVAQAHVENYGMKIFLKADQDDRDGNATKNTAKQFFTAAQIFDMNAVFGEVSDDLSQKSRYAKWRAAYIIKCIKSNEKPLPPEEEKTDDDLQPGGQSDDNQFNQNTNQSDIRPGFNIEPPPATTSSFNEFGINDMNNLTINPHKPSSASSSNFINTAIGTDTGTTVESPSDVQSPMAISGIKLSRDDILKAQKYSKWASSAMDYDDIKNAAINLQKALNILLKGKED